MIIKLMMVNDDYKIKLLLPKMSAYVKSYTGQTKWMYFLIEDDELLSKYSTTLN